MGEAHDRAPCPDRIVEDVGGAFGMGAVGGSIWHVVAGLRNSPRGERFLGASQAVSINAPRLGGSFAVWGGCFASFDCTLVYLRKKEDPWNSIASGFLTGGFLQLRQGPRAALSSAVFGGVLLGLIEGAAIMLNRMTASLPPPPPPQQQMPPPAVSRPAVDASPTPQPAATPVFSSAPSAPASDSAVLLSSGDTLPSSSSPGGASPGAASSDKAPSGSSRSWFSWGSSSSDRKGDAAAPAHAPEKLLIDTAPPPVPDFALKEDTSRWSSK